MISPSKVQHQQHKHPSRDNSDIHSHVRLQKGRKPLEKKSFYLDIKNHALSANLEAKIKDLGGVIELFLVKSVTLIVSDRADALRQSNCDKSKWGYGSGGSGGPPSLRSIEVPTPTPTPPTPFGGEYPLSNSTNIRGQTAQRTKSRADAMLERALTQPQQCSLDPLNNARNWGIPIWATKKLQSWLEKIYETLKDSGNLKRNADQANAEKNLRVRHLKNSYIKFESFKRDTRPVFLELPLWPKLNFDSDPDTRPFDNRVREKKVCKEKSDSHNKEKGKEMTRRPRATATRARRIEQLVAGHCEICRIDYRDLSKHIQSDKHLAFVRNDDNFLSLDTLIKSGASVEAFLKLNGAKDVGEECNLFPNGDRSLHNVNLEDNKVKKSSKSDLSNFGVDEIKMVQCNGTRRNLNLKLSSPHNLRTRTRHESGHLLRSKGSPWHEVQDKSEKFYDKFEGFTIKKRSKGTIWIEEEEEVGEVENAVKKCPRIDEIKEIDNCNDGKKRVLTNDDNFTRKTKEAANEIDKKNDSLEDRVLPTLERSDLVEINNDRETDNGRIVNIPCLEKETRLCDEIVKSNAILTIPDTSEDALDECKNGFNGFERVEAPESFPACQLPGNSDPTDTTNRNNSAITNETTEKNEIESVCNGIVEKNCKFPIGTNKDGKDDKPKGSRIGKRGVRGFRGRQRLSVEERLIEDNRAYYKVEVLGNKLRSSTGPWVNSTTTTTTTATTTTTTTSKVSNTDTTSTLAVRQKKEDEPSSEKPVVVRFKRVRKSELSLLSDEAESFMFGEPRREDSTSEISDGDHSSVLPKDTESEWDEININATDNCTLSSSIVNSSSPIKQEIVDDDSQDSIYMGRARKRRRTQAEALIKDNADYYKFETPGSRLRYQAPVAGLKDSPDVEENANEPTISDHQQQQEQQDQQQEPQLMEQQPQQEETTTKEETEPVEKLYPSKPSAAVEKLQFSFEAVPRSEPWYQTYQRQDEGAEFWHYFSEADERKPFLLPYEIENFHENLAKICQKNEARKRSRGRGPNGLGRSPRKSPRCHASTLAIMSTIIRKREQQQQQQQPSNLSIVEEVSSPRSDNKSQSNTPKPEAKHLHHHHHHHQRQQQQMQPNENLKSDTDGELREIAKNIDEMLGADDLLDPEDSFETAIIQDTNIVTQSSIPRGPPSNLLELLENCHEYLNCRENSSCASSECGEGAIESPLKRRKRRKNRTGWPGIKMRKKLQTKQMIDAYTERENLPGKKREDDKRLSIKAATRDAVCQRLQGNVVDRITESSTQVTSIKCENQSHNADELVADSCASRITDKCSINESSVKQDGNQLSGDVIERDGARNLDECQQSPPLQCETISGSEESAIKCPNDDYSRKSVSIKDPEISENALTNDENHENVCRPDSNAGATRQLNSKTITRNRRRVSDTSSEVIDSRQEIENHDNLYRNNVNSSIISRKNYTTNGLSKRRQQRDNTAVADSHDSEHSVDARNDAPCQKEQQQPAITRKQMRTRIRQRRGTLRSELDYEDENCKNPTSIKSNKTPDGLRTVKRRNNEPVASETLDSEIECALAERVSPTLIPTTELEHRRSSIEFQPVVRMMKIEDQVDMDHSILSVTVASNRRLRSSSSPRSNVQPPAKRYKRTKGPLGRWSKNS